MNAKIKTKNIIIAILAIFIMFLPRKLELFGIFSFRLFIIIAMFISFCYKKSINISFVKKRPFYLLFIIIFSIK